MYRAYRYKEMVKVVCTFPTLQKKHSPKLKSEAKASSSAVSRARAKIRKYVECGNFTHFVTFTFSDRNIDRTDKEACRRFITNFLTREYPDSPYLLVPEEHEDGAIHFHGFIGIDESRLAFAGFKKLRSGRNIRRYRDVQINEKVGRNVFERIDDNKRLQLSYVLKYVGKELGCLSVYSSLYFCSRGLTTPELLFTFSERQKKAFFNFLKVNSLRFFNSKFCSIWEIPLDLWQEFIDFQWYYEVLYDEAIEIQPQQTEILFANA